jgi:hypothetical protein
MPDCDSLPGAVDVNRAADLYTQGWTLHQIGVELGDPWAAVSHQLRRAGGERPPVVFGATPGGSRGQSIG